MKTVVEKLDETIIGISIVLGRSFLDKSEDKEKDCTAVFEVSAEIIIGVGSYVERKASKNVDAGENEVKDILAIISNQLLILSGTTDYVFNETDLTDIVILVTEFGMFRADYDIKNEISKN